MDEISDAAIARIKGSRIIYTKQEQKAELLKRNQRFLNDFKELEKSIRDNCHGLDIKKITSPGAFNDYPELMNEPVHPFKYFDREFRSFCRRWDLYLDWNGSLDKLSSSLIKSPSLEFSHLTALSEEINYMREPFPKQSTDNFLHIRIDPWTNLRDIKDLWPNIEELQKKIFDYTPEKKADTFGRDLAWYDLKKVFGLTHGQIAKAWVKYCPGDVDPLVIKAFKRKYRNDLKGKLKGRVSVLKDNPCLLESILNSELGADIRTMYEVEKRIYTTGEYEPGTRFTPPLLDTIKQGIKRIEKYIGLVVSRDLFEKITTWLKETKIKSRKITDVPWLAELAKIEADKRTKIRQE
jgi:hypothetical protein